MSTFEIIPDGHGFIVSGELDLANAREFAAAFREALPVGGPVTIEMRQLKFMDSSGINTIVAAAKLAPSTCIVLHGVHDGVQMVVELTGIEALPNLKVIPCTIGL